MAIRVPDYELRTMWHAADLELEASGASVKCAQYMVQALRHHYYDATLMGLLRWTAAMGYRPHGRSSHVNREHR